MGKLYTALGLMSGTSMDGVDASIISSDGKKEYSVKLNKYFEYSDELRQKLINIRPKIHKPEHLEKYSIEIREMEREITLFHANVVNEILSTSKINVDLLGFHGHTIFHDGDKKISKQLGDGKLLSQLTNKIVIYNFRQKDIQNGGQGAPLTPIFHNVIANKFLKKELNESFSVNFLNIGGIANITQTVKWENSEDKLNDIKASDIAPGNCLIDEWIRKNTKNKYDNNGILASSGKTNELILNQALENFNINQPYENSLDINDFDISFVKGLSLENGAATLTDFTAAQIIKALLYSVRSKKNYIWLICGGGRKNVYLFNLIKNQIAEYSKMKDVSISIFPIEKIGIDGDFVESQAFGYLAIRSFLKLPISFPNTTRCKVPTCGGILAKNF